MLLLLAAPDALAQNGPSAYDAPQLMDAETAYQAGRYEAAIDLTEKRLDASGVSTLDRMHAYRLQGLAYTAQGDQEHAREAVNRFVIIYPDYEVSPEDPKAFNALVKEAQDCRDAGELTLEEERGSGVMQYVYTSVAVGLSAAILGYGFSDLF